MANWAELEELAAELREAKGVPPADKLSTYLKLVRELHTRQSDQVTKYGYMMLKYYPNRMGQEEFWLVHEQVAIAALDSGALSYASDLIKVIAKKFPSSQRTKRLQGMFWEASGHLDRAESLYTEALRSNPASEMLGKRLIALEKTRGNIPGAIEALKKYLEIFANDREAWEELADLYIEALLYRQALFCVEELLTYSPMHPPYLTKYADLLYTVGGGSATYRLARSYYAKAVEVTNGQSARALFGVLACCANITDKVAIQDTRTRAQIELPDLTAQALIKLYRTHAPDKLPMLEPLLERQGLL